MTMVICNQAHHCTEASMCGGARPHRHDPSECGKCVWEDQECKSVKEDLTIPQELIDVIKADWRLVQKRTRMLYVYGGTGFNCPVCLFINEAWRGEI